MHVIATAGHVDHGKSTLIRALTGMEPDRWAEEQRRGMTIDLGYAWTTLADGETLAFVDVPGHERFVTNMLAGVGPVPAVLFVVAADGGWGAQSAEHLAALDALGVRHGVLVITRSDLGDAERAGAQARAQLVGTSLQGIETVAVSAPAGTGLAELRAALGRLVAALPRPVDQRTRLWVDRVFSIRGAGTVVTGTLTGGVIRLGEELQVHPGGAIVRVRKIETLKQVVEHSPAVARVALNLRGTKVADIHRGDALTGPGQWLDVDVMDVRLATGAVPVTGLVLHLGAAAVPVRVRRLGADIARLTLARPLPASVGERVVLRDPGGRRIMVAATVLDVLPPPLHRRGSARLRALELAEVSGGPDPAAEIRRRGAVRRSQLARAGVPIGAGQDLDQVVVQGDWLVAGLRWQEWGRALLEGVEQWARRHPLAPGMPRQSAVAQLELPDAALLDALVRESSLLVIDEGGIHRRDHVKVLPPPLQDALAQLVQRLAFAPFAAPEIAVLQAAGLTEAVLAVAVGEGRLVRIAAGIYLGADAPVEAVRWLRELDQPFTMAAARQVLRTTRRVAVPLLEFLDRAGLTVRVDSQLRRIHS